MKFKTTRKAINSEYKNRICVSYCALQHLLDFQHEFAYVTRAEGWAADIYDFGNTAIITGYAPFGNIKPGYDICREYDEKARIIRYDYSLSWQEQEEKINQLLQEFIQEVTQ